MVGQHSNGGSAVVVDLLRRRPGLVALLVVVVWAGLVGGLAGGGSLAVTGGVITSAGVVLAATFAVLGVLPLVFLAELGFAVAFGVLLDTLVVRSLLVPALTLELGDRTWWPSALSRPGERALVDCRRTSRTGPQPIRRASTRVSPSRSTRQAAQSSRSRTASTSTPSR